MRCWGLIAVALLIGACSESGPVVTDGLAEPAKSSMETEADKVCAEVTSFRPDLLAGKPPEMQSKLRREYELCVKSVASEGALPVAASGSVEASGLRGRTTAP